MIMDTPRVLSTKTLFDHPYATIRIDVLDLEGGPRPYFYLASPVDAVATVGLTADGCLLLTRQYRHPVSQTIYDLPAGRLEPGEAPVDGARREFEEETGYKPGEMVSLGYYNQFPGMLRAGTHLFFARDLTRTRQHLDEGEVLEVAAVPVADVLVLVLSGAVLDGSLQLGVLLAHAKGLLPIPPASQPGGDNSAANKRE